MEICGGPCDSGMLIVTFISRYKNLPLFMLWRLGFALDINKLIINPLANYVLNLMISNELAINSPVERIIFDFFPPWTERAK